MNTDLELWSLVLGAILPPFIAILQQPRWPRPLRAAATLVVCLAVGAVTAYLNHAWDGGAVTGAVLTTLIAAWTSYQHLWAPVGVAPAIEAATALPGPQPAPRLKASPPPTDT